MNRLIVFCCLLSIPFISNAQFTVSPKVGINYMWVGDRPDGIDRSTADKGWQAGVDVRLGKRFYFQPGIYYVNTGATINSLEDVKDIKTGKASFMKIPANIGFKLIDTWLLKLRIHGGGTANKLLNVREKGDLAKADFNTWNYGANVGAGIDVLIFSLDANYEWGLTDLYAQQAGSKPTMFSVSVGMKF